MILIPCPSYVRMPFVYCRKITPYCLMLRISVVLNEIKNGVIKKIFILLPAAVLMASPVVSLTSAFGICISEVQKFKGLQIYKLKYIETCKLVSCFKT